MDEREQLQRSIFGWVAAQETSIEQRHETITAYDVATKYGVPKEIFVEHIEQEIEEAESCQSLPFTLLLVVSYALMVIAHDDAAVVNAVEDSIDFDIEENANFAFSSDFMGHKAIFDVNSHADFWSWMQKGFVPLIFQQGNSFSEGSNSSHPAIVAASVTFPRRDRGMLLNYNRIVGGIRMSQERSGETGEESKCPTSPNSDPLLKFYGKKCVGGLKYELDPEYTIAKETTDPKGITWLYINDDVEDIQEQMIDMETSLWLDEHTRKIELAIPVYNAEYGLHTLILVNFFFSRGGHIWKDLIPMSTYATWYDSWAYIIYDMLWVSCILYILIVELKEVIVMIREKGPKAIINEYLGFWNIVDWGSVVVAFMIMALFNITLLRTATLNEALEKLGTIDEMTNRAEYRAQMDVHIAALEVQVHGSYELKLVLATYPLIIVLRLFKAFASQPRLAVVTKTLECASVDLVHFLLVFSSVFLTYATAACVLFGREVDAFTTFGRSTNACFRSMMGDFDWEAISTIGRMEAGIWFWTFMIIVVLLMLNMLLAIVMDAYSEVKMSVGNAETLWEEAGQAFARWQGQRKGFLVPLSEVMKALKNPRAELKRVSSKVSVGGDKDDPEAAIEYTLVTVEYLRRYVPSLRVEQAVHLIETAVEGYYAIEKEEADMEELLQIVRKVNYRTKKLKKQVHNPGSGEGDDEPDAVDFSDELSSIQSELAQAMADLGAGLEEEEEQDGEDATGWGKRPSHDHGGSTHRKQTVKPFHNLEEVIEGMMAVIVDNVDKVLEACRASGIGVENDALRKATCGTEVQVLEKDAHDNTVKIRVPGVGDLWYGFAALGPVPEETGAHGAGSSTQGESAANAQHEGDSLEKRISELEGDLRAGRQTVSEALMAVSELEWRLHQAHEGRRQVKGKFELLKKKMMVLHKENKRLEENLSEMEGKIEAVSGSKNEYFELVRKMVDENQELKIKIAEAQKTANPGERNGASDSQHRHLQQTLEVRLDEALAERSRVEESTVRAYQNLAQRVQEIAFALEHSRASSGRGSPRGDTTPRDIARELLALRDGAKAMLRKSGAGGAQRSPREQGNPQLLAIQDGPAESHNGHRHRRYHDI